MKITKITILLFLFLSFSASAQLLEKDIVDGFSKGKTELISYHANDEVELITPTEDGMFDRENADRKLFSFFQSHKAQTFKIVHNGESPAGDKYLVGELTTQNENFRVYLLLSSGGEPKITEIRIESDD